ncbi:MAG: type II toxin-antitoxin system VapC family toxin [Rhodospirillales bacterium]|nr:type II toxin-antitoxin system VapC family toxin [Rhodospirillales bacterium]
MLRHMLDTDICIRVLRDRPQSARERFNAEAEGLCISSVTLGELLYGAEKSARPVHHRRQVDSFASLLQVLDFDGPAALHFAEIRASLERKGQSIGAYDTMIAAHARSRGLVVITGNLKEFSRVEGLRSENWL